MKVVVDASVVLKWLLVDRPAEPDTDRATALMRSVVERRVEIVQPAHWLLEVGAVLARLAPDTAAGDLDKLYAMALPVRDEPSVLRGACELAIELGQHLFDTLYHAVALETEDAILVTADARYLRVARPLGRICTLAEWQLAG